MWIRLNKACTSPLNIRLPLKKGTYRAYKYVSFEPNKEYDYDEDVAEIALAYTVQQKYTKEREDALKAANCVYEVKLCRVCGGKRTNLVYHPIERA